MRLLWFASTFYMLDVLHSHPDEDMVRLGLTGVGCVQPWRASASTLVKAISVASHFRFCDRRMKCMCAQTVKHNVELTQCRELFLHLNPF